MTERANKYLRRHTSFDGESEGASADLPDISDSDLVNKLQDVSQNSIITLALLSVICCNYESDFSRRRSLLQALTAQLFKHNYLDLIALPACQLLFKNPELCDRLAEFISKVHQENFDIASYAVSNLFVQNDVNLSKPNQDYIEKFEELGTIAESRSRKVCKSKHKLDGMVYAIKKIYFKYENDSEFKKILREAKSLAKLKHKNIVQYNSAWLEIDDGTESVSASNCSSESDHSSKIHRISDDRSNDTTLPTASQLLDAQFNEITINVVKSGRRRRHSSGATCSLIDGEITEENVTTSKEIVQSVNFNKNLLQPPEIMNVISTLYIQMEYFEGDLESWLNEKASCTENSFQSPLNPMSIFKQMLQGVEHIHLNSIIHRDLKPKNIFIAKETGIVKIGDFGLACLVSQTSERNTMNGQLSSVYGTAPYSAPEQKEGHDYDFKVDIYSLGIILLELISPCTTKMEFSKKVENALNWEFPDVNLHDWQFQIDAIKRMIQKAPQNRPTANEILQLPFFQKNQRMVIEYLNKKIANMMDSQTRFEDEVNELKEIVEYKNERILELEKEIQFYEQSK